jgi:transcriptional regulator with GAF, ATPase, and Fis domain
MRVKDDTAGKTSAREKGDTMEQFDYTTVKPGTDLQVRQKPRTGGIRREFGAIDWSDLSQSFSDLIQTLNRQFSIERAALAICDDRKECLRVTHIYERNAVKSGLTLTIPGPKSTMYHVLKQGFPVADNYPDLFAGNIIEKRIMMTPESKAVLTIPLRVDGHDLGVVNLASREPGAFGLFIEGIAVDPVEQFGAMLYTTLVNS